MRANAVALTFLLALCAFVGCKEKELVVPVSGMATYQGKPLANCTVFFTPINTPNANMCVTSAGKTNEEGRFELTTTEIDARKGAVVGQHRVSFKFMQWGTELTEDEDAPKEKLPNLSKEYTQGTKIKFVVPENGTDAANFDLD